MRLLPCYPWPVDKINQERISHVLKQMNITDVQPCPAVPGTPARILSLDGNVPWLHEGVAVVSHPENLEGLRHAITAVLSPYFDARLSKVLGQLRSIFGEGVVEIGVHFE